MDIKKILVQSEFEATRYYMAKLHENKKLDRCECGGVNQNLGVTKEGRPKYRRQHNCFHVQWARQNYKEGEQVLFSGCFSQ